MREFPWRSLARPLLLAAALAAGGACAPKLDLNNRPPPCSDGFSLCPATGACQADAPPSDTPVRDPADPSKILPVNCASSVSVRQGGTLSLAAPGTTLENLTVESAGDLTATSVVDGHGAVAIEVSAPHGAPQGEKFGDDRRFVTVTTTLGGTTFVRHVLVPVSYITAAPGGDDGANDGTLGRPFATIARAGTVARAGDTIQILAASKDQDSTNTPSSETGAASIPDGVTLQGVPILKSTTTIIPILVRLDLEGDANLENLQFVSERLVVRQPGSHVRLTNDDLSNGLTIDRPPLPITPAAGPVVDLTSTVVSMPDQVSSMPTSGPIVVRGDGATLNLGDAVSVRMPLVGSPAPLDAIRFEGNGQTLTMASGVRVENSDGGDALHVAGSANVTVTNVRFINPVEFDPSTTNVAAFESTSFNIAPLTFHGQKLTLSNNTTFSDSALTFQGQTLQIFDTIIETQSVLLDVVQGKPGFASDVIIQNGTFRNAPMTFGGHELSILGSTTFTDSLLTFQGRSLIASDATFIGQGIVHTSAGSTSTLQNVSFTNYKQFGYRLVSGRVDVVESRFAHDPSASPSLDGLTGPWALRVEAAGDTESSLVSHATTYDGQGAPSTECDSTPPVSYGGVLWVLDDTVPITLCP